MGRGRVVLLRSACSGNGTDRSGGERSHRCVCCIEEQCTSSSSSGSSGGSGSGSGSGSFWGGLWSDDQID